MDVGSEVSGVVASVSETGIYIKLDNNLNGSLKLLQKELVDILENNTLEVSQSIKCNIKSIDKKNFQVVCTLLSGSE
jgi:ribosomal protein S1